MDLDQFLNTYVEECKELLESMEQRLLELNDGEADVEELNAIFRCIHSIKGGAGAFGFTDLESFTHKVEFLLDDLRDCKFNVTQDIIDSLLQSVDVTHRLLDASQKKEEPNIENLAELTERIIAFSSSGGETALSAIENVAPLQKTEVDVAPRGGSSHNKDVVSYNLYSISFVPEKNLLANGSEPLLLLKDLKKLGFIEVYANGFSIPKFLEIDIENCYTSWNIELISDHPIKDIKEVFEFVEDECDLAIEEFGNAEPPREWLLEQGKQSTTVAGQIVQEQDQGKQGDAPMVASSDEGKNNIDNKLSNNQDENRDATNETDNIVKDKKDEKTKKGVSSSGTSSIRVDIDKVDNLVNMVGELVITQAMIMEQAKDLSSDKHSRLIQGVEEFSRHARDLQGSVMAVRMQPVKSIFSRMPRIVRDISRQLGKKIHLETYGENTEIDKTVIEQLGDPLTHMIRNSVDHGIEMPEERVAMGKSEEGIVKLSAYNSGDRIIIEISDNGKGLDRNRILTKAVEKGIILSDNNLSDEEIDNLIFNPGFSTAEKVTNISGRGVGMDVVKRNITELGGTIDVLNKPNEGSTFIVSLPLTLAILEGMIIRIGGEHYILPINSVLETLCPSEKQINRVSEDECVLNVRGEFVPIVFLSKIFNVLDKEKNNNIQNNKERMLIVLVENGRKKIGLVVDELIGQQQVVIKNLEENSDPVEGISGATILGDGDVALIVDIGKVAIMNENVSAKYKKESRFG